MPRSVFPSLGICLCLILYQEGQNKLEAKFSFGFLFQLWQCHAGTCLDTKLSCSRVKWGISKQQCLQRGPVLPFFLVPKHSLRGKDGRAAPLTAGLARGSHPQDETSVSDSRNASNFLRELPTGVSTLTKARQLPVCWLDER